MPLVESLTDAVARPSMKRARRCSVAVLNEALHEGSDGTLALGSLELGWVDAVVQGLAKVHCRNEANQGNNKERSNLTIGQAILLWNWHHQTQLLGALASWHSGQQDLSISHVIGPSWQCHGSCSHSCSNRWRHSWCTLSGRNKGWRQGEQRYHGCCHGNASGHHGTGHIYLRSSLKSSLSPNRLSKEERFGHMQETLGTTPFSSETASSKKLFGWSFTKSYWTSLHWHWFVGDIWRPQKRMKTPSKSTCPKQNDHESFGTHWKIIETISFSKLHLFISLGSLGTWLLEVSVYQTSL